ncbi:hypothetical protein C5C18_10615 [Rathayibacter tritici]|uniref:Uncharacterized protein n=1 Tax=Rathayibacter tritici TaxID=33888 RepID=A0A169C307_9MICO|nr:hypothetical protein [Rathayibacter tritici]AND17235.1 hypothetical protein A6122_2111 [Rathayibacter tritici]PPF29184.1 hypothetical protein C5C06_07040 [Rathayibacter tritici]PPF62145.1 hypothetical protein C5C21_14485 [Rathayibacter tritici]PPG06321.1 hypothetical protein C5C18_10615 [Rathayibacter tritici]PPI11538.1 hypothetical protein C5D07_13970 [Rathayibacter tritici]
MSDTIGPDGARVVSERIIDLIVATREHLDGVPGPTAADSIGVDSIGSAVVAGSAVGFDIWAPHGSTAAADAALVALYWESLGMSVRIARDRPLPVVHGTGGPVDRASFRTGNLFGLHGLYGVDAVAPCGPDRA